MTLIKRQACNLTVGKAVTLPSGRKAIVLELQTESISFCYADEAELFSFELSRNKCIELFGNTPEYRDYWTPANQRI
jgi:hypothetical protein